MRKTLSFLICSFLLPILIYAQDTILQKNGIKLICKIQNQDNKTIYYTTEKNGQKINNPITVYSSIDRKEVQSVHFYNPNRANASNAQKDSLKTKKNGFYGYGILLGIKTDQLLTSNSGNINIITPYKTTDVNTGLTTNQTLITSSTNPFKNRPTFLSLQVELDRKKNIYNFQVGGATNYSSGVLVNFGYGRTFDWNLSKKLNNKITVKGLLNIAMINIETGTLGKIDNVNKYVNIYDTTFKPVFSQGNSKNGYKKYDATDIKANYNIYEGVLNPQLIVACKIKKELNFYWALNVGYLIPFVNKNNISFVQESTGKSGNTKNFQFQDINAYLNGNRIHSNPFSLGGPNIGLSIGFYVSDLVDKNKLKRQDSINSPPCDNAITYKFSKYSSTYRMNGQKISFDKVEQRLNLFNSSSIEYKKHEKTSKIANVLCYVSLSTIITAAIVNSTSNQQQQDKNAPFFGTAILSTIVPFFTFEFISNKHFKKSVKLYNEKMCEIKENSLGIYYNKNDKEKSDTIVKSENYNNSTGDKKNNTILSVSKKNKFTNYVFQKGDTLSLTKRGEIEFKGELLSKKEVIELMSQDDSLACSEAKKSAKLDEISLGTIIIGGTVGATLFTIGAPGIIIGSGIVGITCLSAIPIERACKKHTIKSIQLFNEKHR